MSKQNQEFSIQYPMNIYPLLSGLWERGLMSPSYLSNFIMFVILPAQFSSLVEKRSQDYKVSNLTSPQIKETRLAVNGLETFEIKVDSLEEYKIFFVGNEADCKAEYRKYRDYSEEQLTKNLIFWNYPGVGASTGCVNSVDDLFNAGYQQVQRLLAQGILAKNITLHGHSLGGGVAIHVARQLSEKGQYVNLEIDRSFSSLSAVIPAQLQLFSRLFPNWAPLITSLSAFALSGVALGTTFAGFVASLGQLTAKAIASLGNISALTVPFFSSIAFYIDKAINLLGSTVGGAISLAGLVVGGLVGLVVGILLSIQLLWTKTPFTIPMIPSFRAALYSACCEMDSVREIERLLNTNKEPQISVTGVGNDSVILIEASLYKGLESQIPTSLDKINSFWYRYGNHCYEPSTEIDNKDKDLKSSAEMMGLV